MSGRIFCPCSFCDPYKGACWQKKKNIKFWTISDGSVQGHVLCSRVARASFPWFAGRVPCFMDVPEKIYFGNVCVFLHLPFLSFFLYIKPECSHHNHHGLYFFVGSQALLRRSHQKLHWSWSDSRSLFIRNIYIALTIYILYIIHSH